MMGMQAMISQLMTVKDLKKATFGHRAPRHGLKLLHWFSTKAVKLNADAQIELLCDPDNGDYGFHHFGNFEDLLPRGKTYFEVGNLNTLNHHGAHDLPAYVREAYESRKNSYERNKDRIIISLDRATRLIGEIYITEHKFGLNHFSEEGTFLLSPDIIREAGGMQMMNFLTCAGFVLPISLGGDPSDLGSDETDDDSCGSEDSEEPDWNAPSGLVVSAIGAPSPEEVCSGSPANPNNMDPPDHLRVRSVLSNKTPGVHPESQNTGYQQDLETGVGISHGPDHKQEIMGDAVVMNYFINVEDVVLLVIIVMVVLIMLFFSFKTLGIIIITPLCVETVTRSYSFQNS